MRSTIWHVDSDGLNLEGNGTVFGKHGCDHVDNDVTACQWTSGGMSYSLVLSVAVVSMKMFVVLPGTILESNNQRSLHLSTYAEN